MPKPPRARLARVLAGSEPPKADSAMLRLPGDALVLEVAGLGPVSTPIRAAQARRLAEVARPAKFGRGEKTLSDPSVRDTWELTPDQVEIGGARWQAHLDSALEHFGDELGLPAGARLTAELHSMLIYGKGQFFLPHQDSEKHDGMVASLVVVLPSVHTGGELVVDDAGTERTYRGSRDELVLVAFYADRRHEVRPVRSGHRVTLTFNLILSSPGEPSAGPVAEAATYLDEHFTTRIRSRYGNHDLGEPTRLAFLLDHDYTQSGLAAGRLKGQDADRVATLRLAAERAGCESVLALAEIKETWDALPADEYAHHGWGYDEDEDEDHDSTDYELNELIEDEIVLDWWTSPDGAEEAIRLPLDDHEVCAVTPTRSLTPYESEYEGYMGNYGNTVDRWYRRAAMVIWPRKNAFATRAEAGSAWALRTILAKIDDGDLDGARADATSLEPFWRDLGPELLDPASRVAAALGDASAARMLLAPFRIEMLTADHGGLVAALTTAYGDRWMLDLVDNWEPPYHFAWPDRIRWITETLVPLCRALRDHEADPIADGCADRSWRWLSSLIDKAGRDAHPERRRASLDELAVPAARVLEAASDPLTAIIAEELAGSGEFIIELLVPLLRAHRPPPRPGVAAIAGDCSGRLTRLLDRPARAQGDWSIDWTGCGCDLCDRLRTFLVARSEHAHEWPLATQGRQHIHQQIDAVGVPVRHVTRRQGRPYTLVLTKGEDLFRREDEVRRQARTDLDWIRANWETAALAAVGRYRAENPRAWADHLAEADDLAAADAPITDEWSPS
ncbi:MAG: 2OG-Fe(II) oxygenase [Nocardioides sp.]